VGRLFERFSSLRPALPADQLPWRSSPLMRGLRGLPVHYEMAAAADSWVPRAPDGTMTQGASAPLIPAAPGRPATRAYEGHDEEEDRLSAARRLLRALRLG
jgi:hypothetical protein